MSMIVCKFGGSSVSDAGMFVRVHRILEANPDRRYIVLSAPGRRNAADKKITDLLYRAHAGGDHSIFAQIFERYASVRDALAPDFPLERAFEEIRTAPRSSPDWMASRGEYLCARLFAAYAKLPFVDAEELIFFGADGEVDREKTFRAVRERLAPLERAVIPGFYGRSADGGVRTFSRGGSDVSGAWIAAALRASLYENWTDVDGLYTADPRIVDAPERNLDVSLSQMARIAAAGAQLLHPDALSPLRGAGVDALLKNTFAPGAPGTRVSEKICAPARCVTGRRKLYMLGDPQRGTGPCEPLLHELPLQGRVAVAVVSAFGMTDAQIRRVERRVEPIHIIHMRDHIQIIIPPQEYETTVRAAHEILMDRDGG